MALVLALSTEKGMYIDDILVSVDQILSTSKFKLKVHGKAMDAIYTVDSKMDVEILPNVKVRSGINKAKAANSVRILIDAPRRMRILRQELYENSES